MQLPMESKVVVLSLRKNHNRIQCIKIVRAISDLILFDANKLVCSLRDEPNAKQELEVYTLSLDMSSHAIKEYGLVVTDKE